MRLIKRGKNIKLVADDNCAKLAFATRAKAMKKARQVTHHAGRPRPYLCPHCEQWHLTHEEQR